MLPSTGRGQAQLRNCQTTAVLKEVFNFNRRDIKFREDYQEVQWMDFEFLKMPVPVRYDHALRTRFGDYMQIVKGNSLHSGLFFDTDKPYTEYIR